MWVAAVPSPGAAAQATVTACPSGCGVRGCCRADTGLRSRLPGRSGEALVSSSCSWETAGKGSGKSRVKLRRQVSWIISEDTESSFERL